MIQVTRTRIPEWDSFRYGCWACLLLLPMICAAVVNAQDNPAKDTLIVESLLRLKRYDVSGNEKWKASVLRHLETVSGTQRFVHLSELFAVRESVPMLLKLTTSKSNETVGVQAGTALLNMGETELLIKTIHGKNDTDALAVVEVLGQSPHPEVNRLLEPLVVQNKHSRQLRNMAAIGLSKTIQGQRYLLQLVVDNRLPQDLNFAVGNALYSSADPTIRAKAKDLITLPAVQGADPLPPVEELLMRKGNVLKGRVVFETKGNCIKCHKVQGSGKEVGPDLSEIGSKLSRAPMYVSILDPSAGVSHNYETYSIITVDGNVLSGIKISATAESVVIRNAEGIDRTIPVEEIDEMLKTGLSLMPADLQKTMNVEELVHVVAYLTTLLKPE